MTEPARGRPVDRDKDAAILEAAERLFLEQGYGRTTIEQVARAAGVSKVTIYARHGDKETLFERVVLAKVARMHAGFALGPDDESPLADKLTDFGVGLMRFILSPELIEFDTTLVGEVKRMPSLGHRFFSAGPGFKRAQLAAILERAHERGEIAIDDAIRAAEDLMSLWLGFIHVQRKFGLSPELDDTAIAEKAARAVRLFLRAHAPD